MAKAHNTSDQARRAALLKELEALGRLIDDAERDTRSPIAEHWTAPEDSGADPAATDGTNPDAGDDDGIPLIEGVERAGPVLDDTDDGIPLLDDVVGGPVAGGDTDRRPGHGETVLDDPAIILRPGEGEGEAQDPYADLVARLVLSAVELIERHREGASGEELIEALRERFDVVVARWRAGVD